LNPPQLACPSSGGGRGQLTTPEQLASRLKALGIRQTPQRLAIAEVVVNSGDHPSVKEIYQRVKEFFPYVTLATVYSTLETLEQAGFVRALPFQKQSRYDANLSPHANLVCVGCGRVVDSSEGREIVSEMKSRLEASSDFEFTGQRIDFYGWCRNCADRRNHKARMAAG
jgi:Fur family peroxide stress response transcriptional regulator